MKKGKILSVALGLAVIAPVLAFAQTGTGAEKDYSPLKAIQSENVRENIQQKLKQDASDVRDKLQNEAKDIKEQVREVRMEAQDKREEIKNEFEMKREEFKKEFESKREEVKSTIQARQLTPEAMKVFQDKREEIKNEFEMKREEFKKEFESKREEVKQEIEMKRAEFKDKIKNIKDETRKSSAEKLFNDLNSLNSKMVGNLKKSTDQIEAVLNRILSRSEKASANGEDMTAVNAASDLAKKAIEDARAAIQIQSGKVYSTVSTSTSASDKDTLRADLTLTRNQLRQDLESVSSKIKAARDAVHDTAIALAQIPKVDELEVTK